MWLRAITPTKGVMVRQHILQLFSEVSQWASLVNTSELPAPSVSVKDQSLSSGVVQKDTSARYPEVLNRVWLQLMCCALLINLVPNFRARSKVGTRSEIGARLEERARSRIYVDFLTEEYRCISTAI